MDFAKSTTPASAPHYLSSRSADALISDLRPASLAPPALHALNGLLDELLAGLVRHAESIDPEDLKVQGVPGVFGGRRASEDTSGGSSGRGGRALGRDAVGEAEVELRAWKDGQKGGAAAGSSATAGFARYPRGIRTGGGTFPVDEAVNMLRCKIVGLSTLASHPAPPHVDKAATEAWSRAGGATSEQVIAPAALYLTAIIEHVCEHVLVHIGRVISRESSRRVATLQDLYVALCEDEGAWDMFRRMEVKSEMEEDLRASGHGNAIVGANARAAAATSDTPAQDGVPVVATASGGIRPVVQHTRSHSRNVSSGSTVLGAGGAGVIRAPGFEVERDRSGAASPIDGSPAERHTRSGSVLSATTRGMLGAYDESRASLGGGARRSVDTQGERTVPTDEFDQLVKSGQTVRVSLTPSRLKTFDSSGSLVAASKQSSPAKASALARKASVSKPSSTPRNGSVKTPTPGSPSASTKESSVKISPQRSVKPSASSSANRLIPKDVATDDDATESIGYGKPSGKGKESLMDVLSADPPWGAAAGRGPVAKGPRQVPAVVVGAGPRGVPPPLGPPIGSKAEASASKGKLTPRSPTISPEQDDVMASPQASKTPTQELADFFMTEPPPPPPISDLTRQKSIESSRTAGSKPKGFRKMMDRLTGKSPSSGNLRNDYSSKSNGANQSLQPKKSSASFTSADVAPPSSYRPVQQGPLEQSNRVNGRRPSQSSATRPTVSPRAESLEKVPQVVIPAQRSPQIQERAHLQATRQAPSVPDGPALPQVRAEAPHKPEIQALRANAVDQTESSKTPAVAAGAAALAATGLTGLGIANLRPTTMDAAPNQEDAKNQSLAVPPVATQDRGIPDSAVAVEATPPGASQDKDEEPATPPAKEAPPTPQDPSIPLARLGDLRNVIAHATSADECRMLVEAMLCQWRVPQAGAIDSAQVSPEAKITAWLLSGREGPPSGIEA